LSVDPVSSSTEAFSQFSQDKPESENCAFPIRQLSAIFYLGELVLPL
jgi:hypothetical protein